MSKERFVPIRSHGLHVSERNKHLLKGGMATIGAITSTVLNQPELVGVVLGGIAIYELTGAVDHHNDRKKIR